MAGKGLIISIDYSDENCQACYYSYRHQQPESISAGSDLMRYLIPSVLCYDPEKKEWGIGNYAFQMAEKEGCFFFRNLLENVRAGTVVTINGTTYTYVRLMALFFRKLLEFIQIRTSVMMVQNITVTMKHVDLETKKAFEQVFGILQIPRERVRLLSSAESFGYYILHEPQELWEHGALLFDFSSDGFLVKQLDLTATRNGTFLFVNEYDLSDAFSVRDLASEMLRLQLDRKLNDLYQDLLQSGDYTSVYFTGDGFDEQWFTGTLANISGSRRAFKGNNIYVKGACIAGYMRTEKELGEFPILCPGRTRTQISLDAWDQGKAQELVLSPAASAWYDAGYQGDFILENETFLVFHFTSLMDGQRRDLRMDLAGFPERPAKTTRVEIQIRYQNEKECEIILTDKGFGDFYPSEGAAVSQKVQLDEYL